MSLLDLRSLEEESEAGSVTGTLSVTLGGLLLTGTGLVAVAGTAAPTLGALTSAGTGTVQVRGTAAPTLGTLACSGAGTVEVRGALASTLGALTGTDTGTADIQGALSATLDALALAGTGDVGGGASEEVPPTPRAIFFGTPVRPPWSPAVVAARGSLSATLGSVNLSAAATVSADTADDEEALWLLAS